MLPYFLLAAGVAVLGFILCEWKKPRYANEIFLSVSSVAMVVFASLRDHTVGVDYDYTYAPFFQQVCDGGWPFLISDANGYRIEMGYSLLNYLVSLISHDVRVLMLVIAIVSVTLTAVLLYKYCQIPWLGMTIFILFGFYGNTLSFIRQSIAIAIFLFAIKYLCAKKMWPSIVPYMIIILVAASFHKSILIMVPAYFIARLAVNWKWLVVYAAAMVLVMSFSWQLFDFVTGTLGLFSHYATLEGLYYMNGRDWNTAVVPVLCGIAAFACSKIILKRNPNAGPLINMSVYSMILFIMTCQHFLFQRLAMMFFTTTILLIPMLIKCADPDEEKIALIEARINQSQISEKAKEKEIAQKKKELKYYYYDFVAAALVVGFLYLWWQLSANRIALVPYVTFL
ncbi:MAG TPA: EpsG family protein [Candidatus Gallacutalibacter pullicola]|uniref:EpsG family protein n=1 Tax=Candidatus Gallacutalibacter pullicola TaxID=2840830 RepID=A0A9D1J1X7_9FIRM|nr:EpsG family protein [Candidatus Gallacutalibacter pullicola]